jgi:ligand-binding sensor domain-containing protein/DNA-binding CsgD family transcriptional regulator
MRWKLLLLFFCLGFLSANTQNTIALPEIVNYSKQSYNGGTQNWEIGQDKQGIIYVANNEGLLSFDGTYWKLYPLPNRTNVRSLEISPDGKIYVGGQDEIGYFSPDKTGTLAYTSLRNLIPAADRSFTDVWDVIYYKNELFFRSNHKIFVFANNTITSYYSPSEWRFMATCNGMMIAQDRQKGLLQYDNGQWRPFLEDKSLSKESFLVTGLVPLKGDSLLLTTYKEGIFIVAGNKMSRQTFPAIANIASERIYRAQAINNDWIVLGTVLGGGYIINKEGELIQTLSRKEGLQNNNILSIFMDSYKNLWFGLDNGLDFIAFNNAIKHINPEGENQGSGYAVTIFKDHLYLGTSNGLYQAPIQPASDLSFIKRNFEPVVNSKGQVWNLSEVNGHLLMGHHEGAFTIENNTASLLESGTGYWNFLPFSNVLPSDIMIAGNYYGLDFYRFSNGIFKKTANRINFESARFVTIDNRKTIWVAHPYKGIYKITLDDSGRSTIKLYADKSGLFSINNNFVFKVKNHVVIATEKGIYEYNSDKDSFEVSAYFKNIFKSSIRYLKEDPAGNIWFIHDKNLGVVDFSGPKPKIIYLSELNNKMVSGFENIYPYDEKNIFLGGEKGFYHINYEQYKKNNYPLQAYIGAIATIGKDKRQLYGGYAFEKETKQSHESINYNSNSLHFEYSCTLYGQKENIEYSYYLKGFDKEWSEWSKKTEKDYTNLPAGTYTFQVKVRNNLGNESAASIYSFIVLPPFYQSNWAYLIYFLLLFTAIYLLYKWQKRKFLKQRHRYEEERKRLQYLHQLQVEKHEEEQKQLQYLHQLELERSEKEIIRLRNEKLEAEIQLKNTELASTTLNLIQKGEMLVKVKEEFVRMKKTGEADKESDDYKKIIRMLGEDKLKKNWEEFAVHFDKVHSDFLVSLKSQYPNLTPSELKLCAYLRLNLSSKEIAQIMNITIKSVELGRYRLRKKLQIPSEVNLFNFLLNFHSELE